MIKKHFKGIRFFWRGLKASRTDMWASMQVLVISTIGFCTILYFVEHAAQPEVYAHWYDPYVWGFMSYLGNPGKFSPGEPITFVGRFISIIISIIKILIFVVPAGLVANGFREAMTKDRQEKKNKTNAEKIRESIHVHCSLLKGVRFWPKKLYRFPEIKVNLDMSDDEIINAVRSVPYLRLRDLASALPAALTEGVRPEMMAVEMCYANCSYGYFETKPQSNVTIVCNTGHSEIGLAYFTYHISQIGKYNVVINEQLSSNSDNRDNRCVIKNIQDYQYNDPENYPKLHQFVDDVKSTISSPDNWVIILTHAPTPKGEKRMQKIRLWINVDKESEENTLDDCTTVNDTEQLKKFYDDLCTTMKAKHEIEIALKYTESKANRLQNYIRNRFGDEKVNVIEIGLTGDYRVFNKDVKLPWISIKTLTDIIHRNFDQSNTECTSDKWTTEDVKRYRSPLIPKHKGE